MLEIAKNVVMIKGANRGAIYNLNSGEVYSIDQEAVEIILHYQQEQKVNIFLDELEREGIFDYTYINKNYLYKTKEKGIELAWLEITQNCNMRCIHCYEGEEHVSKGNLLSLDEWKKVIDDLKELGVGRVVVIGGEPCIHKNIIQILKYLCENNLSTTLFTNGYFLNGELLKTVILTKTRVKVSLYGHNANIHEKITGIKGSFNKLIAAIRQLEDNKVDVHVAITIMKENENYINEIRSFVRSLGVQGYKFDVIREVVCGTQSIHVPISREAISFAFRWKPNFYVSKDQFDWNIDHNSCWYGKIVISENGDVLPCVFARNHIVNNIRFKNIKEIMDSDILKYWDMPLGIIETCKDCEYRYACKDCRPIAESANALYSKNPRCKYDPYKGVWANDNGQTEL